MIGNLIVVVCLLGLTYFLWAALFKIADQGD